MSESDEIVVTQPARVDKDRRKLPSWRLEELRTTFWVIPSMLVVVAALLFDVTYEIDVAAFHHRIT